MGGRRVMDGVGRVAGRREGVPAGVAWVGGEGCLAAEIAAASGVAGGRSRPRGPRSARGTGAGAAGGKRGYMRRVVTVAAVTAAAAAALTAVAVVQNQLAHRLPTAAGSHRPKSAPVPGPAVTAAQLVAYAPRAAAAAAALHPKPAEWLYTKDLAATSPPG